jgi:integrase
MARRKLVPKYRLHKQSGQAIVTLRDALGGRRDVLLGKYGSPESRAEYLRVLAEWEASGHRTPRPTGSSSDLTVSELILRYWRWAERHYLDGEGKPSRELENMKDALRPLCQMYAQRLAWEFGPLGLRVLQEHLARSGLCRGVINSRINRIRRVFKWAVSYELLPPAVYEALRTVPGLARGRGQARETEPVKPVPEETVVATLPHMPGPVAAMVQIQLLSGCRPGEAMAMRGTDLNMTGLVWIYSPHGHKNRHRGLERTIYLGPKAQRVVRPFLKADLHAYLFSPREYVETLYASRALRRRTKRTPSDLRRQRKAAPKRQPAERYNRRSYRVAIVRACRKAKVPEWSPLQLRHSAATELRARYGCRGREMHSRPLEG